MPGVKPLETATTAAAKQEITGGIASNSERNVENII
jgi:hypothetical protein